MTSSGPNDVTCRTSQSCRYWIGNTKKVQRNPPTPLLRAMRTRRTIHVPLTYSRTKIARVQKLARPRLAAKLAKYLQLIPVVLTTTEYADFLVLVT